MTESQNKNFNSYLIIILVIANLMFLTFVYYNKIGFIDFEAISPDRNIFHINLVQKAIDNNA